MYGYGMTYLGTVDNPLLLDTYSGASAAYSLRKLRTAYSGNAIRVRRSSDNAEQDIGFVGGVLDTATLLTFCGAGSGYIRTFYDQTAGGNNAFQTTSAYQPMIVNAGSLVTKNGKAALDFDGTNDFLQINNESTWLGSYSNLSIFNVLAFDNATNRSMFNSRTFAIWTDGTKTRAYSNSVSRSQQNFTYALGTQYLVSSIFTSDLDRYINGTINTKAAASGLSLSTTHTYIGSYNNGTLSFMYDGTIQEMIFYASSQAANRTAIETLINTYYGIY